MLGNLAKVGLPIATNLLQSLFAKKGGWNPEDINFGSTRSVKRRGTQVSVPDIRQFR